METLTKEQLTKALAIRDLTNPNEGAHAMQNIIKSINKELASLPNWKNTKIWENRGSREVLVKDNYDRLRYPVDGIARESRYTRYIDEKTILRTQMSAVIPPALDQLNGGEDTLLLCPGIVYRRDVIDKSHVGEPHQLDLWRVSPSENLDSDDLLEMIAAVVEGILPGAEWKGNPTSHNYTLQGIEIMVKVEKDWLEIGECGLAHPEILRASGLTNHSGLAMGIGLDRALMLRKGIKDIRLLRSNDPRVKEQMLDLSPYREVSNQPATSRDISVAIRSSLEEEQLGDIVREALDSRIEWLESMDVISRTAYSELPPQAIKRLGMSKEQENILLKLTLRHPTDSIDRKQANLIINQVYKALHEGNTSGYAY